MSTFTHIDGTGSVRMVDVSAKEATRRTALAQALVCMRPSTLDLIHKLAVKKGNVLETARIAGILAAKKTAELIPMCHPLNITHAAVDFFPEVSTGSIRIEASVSVLGQTGVEMEALTAVTIAALTIYDMCKSHDKTMTISEIYLREKSGGRSGRFTRNEPPQH